MTIQSLLDIDAAKVAAEIEENIRTTIFKDLRRKGAVLGLSGGIDSTVVAALAVRALGKDRVLGLLMPESESSSDSTTLGKAVADWLGIETRLEDISPILVAAGCYRRRDEAIRELMPEYGEGYKCKLVTSDVAEGAPIAISSIVVQTPDGTLTKRRLTATAHLAIVAASNFKQRTRKMIEYYYADRYQYAVLGTPNRLEYDQGFFVKNGDGAADLKPIAHLYKTQVYALAQYLGVPEEIYHRPPTTDTYPLEQSQQEFFFSLPYKQMDLCLFAKDNGWPPEVVAESAALTPEQTARVYTMIDSKRRATRYLHRPPVLINQRTDVQMEIEEGESDEVMESASRAS